MTEDAQKQVEEIVEKLDEMSISLNKQTSPVNLAVAIKNALAAKTGNGVVYTNSSIRVLGGSAQSIHEIRDSAMLVLSLGNPADPHAENVVVPADPYQLLVLAHKIIDLFDPARQNTG